MTKQKRIISWITAGVAAIILLQTLFFKFSGAEVSKHIFETIGAEPYGRIGTGVLELVAGILLLIPSMRGTGAVIAMGLMAGAIATHLGPLGIEVMGDGGQLFGMAVVVFILSAIAFFLHKSEVPIIGKWFSAA